MICALAAPVCAQTPDGESVADDDIEQRSRLDFLGTHKQASRQDVINELAEERQKIREAEKLDVAPTSADVDAALAEMCSRMRITPDQMARSLERNGIHADTLKQRIRADMARNNLDRLHRLKF